MSRLLPGAALLALSAAAGADVRYVDASIDVRSELGGASGVFLGASFVDLDGDGVDELLTTVWAREKNRRQLHVRSFDERGLLPGQPDKVVPIMEDVVAYAIADVREEPGKELVFLTRSGAWSYSLEKDGYRGNIARLAEAEMLLDVPDPRDLPRWLYVDERANQLDGLILPLAYRLSYWLPGEDAPGYTRARNLLDGRTESDDDEVVEVGDDAPMTLNISSGGERLFLDEDVLGISEVLSSRRGYRGPAFLDVDGDGHRDLVTLGDGELHLHMGSADGPPEAPSRVEPLPDALKAGKQTLRLVDLNGDGKLDVITELEDEGNGLENRRVDVHVYLQKGGKLLGQLDQMLRFEAAELRVGVADIDGDGLPDLVVRKFEVPGLLSAATGLEFKLTSLLYLGTRKDGPFEKRPVLRHEQTFDETTVQGAIVHRELRADLSGDGICDLVSIELDGRVAIRRLLKKSSFFGGDRWSLEREPWKSFDARGNIASLSVRDVNGDGLGDILSQGARRITVLLSQDVRRKR